MYRIIDFEVSKKTIDFIMLLIFLLFCGQLFDQNNFSRTFRVCM